MAKDFEDMSPEEHGQLFPIFLVEPNAQRASYYAAERESLLSLIPRDCLRRISHIGSTSIPGIWAKNIVDILVEVRCEADLYTVQDLLLNRDYSCLCQMARQITLNKGYTDRGFADQVFHLHIRIAGDNDELYFRDYLIEHEAVAREYESLKRSLWKLYEHDRARYTDAKTDFIQAYTRLAKEAYGDRYKA
ncbi:MAG: GrpB family protein [Eubacteriales bacterium]|nr:GrpB family protein [Eubacteriales bacterium]